MALGDDLVIGVSVNNVTGITGKTYTIHDLIHAGVEAEAMGFDAIWVHDAMMGRRTTAAYCPINALTAVAAQTKTLKLCTGILTPQVRNPVMTAQQWATLYDISEGRAIMGVAMGAGTPTLIKREFEGLASLKHDTNLNPAELCKKRGKVFDECMDVMRRLWSEDKVTYNGDNFRFNGITLGMACPSEMPPVLMGSGIYFPTQLGGPLHHGWKEKMRANTCRASSSGLLITETAGLPFMFHRKNTPSTGKRSRRRARKNFPGRNTRRPGIALPM
jgi:hypothetical protein